MARLPKCPVCQQGRQVLYSRQGKTYNKGHKAMKATDYRICHSCDTIFDKNDNIHYQAVSSVEQTLIDAIKNYFDVKKLNMVNSKNINDEVLNTLSLAHEDMKGLINNTFSQLKN